MRKFCKFIFASVALLVAPFTRAAVVEWSYTVELEWTGATFDNGGANSNAIVFGLFLSRVYLLSKSSLLISVFP